MQEPTVYQPVKAVKGALPERVARQILDLIASKRLEVGSRLPPLDELCEHLGVSRASLREAIKLLDAWGAVTVKHGVGTFVAGLAEDSLAMPLKVSAAHGEKALFDLHKLREALEPDIAAAAAHTARPEHVKKLEKALRRMEQALDDPREYIQADLVFHSTLAEATGNALFLIVIHPVIDLLQDARRLAIRCAGAGERAQAFHRLILEHVKAGRADEAREAMRAHLDQTWGEIQSQMEAK